MPFQCSPLREIAKPTDKVGIVFSDITRPTANQLILPVVLAELAHVPERDITLFDALGTHRPNTETELRGMLGDELVDRYGIVQNNAFDPSTQLYLCTSARRHEMWLNRELGYGEAGQED